MFIRTPLKVRSGKSVILAMAVIFFMIATPPPVSAKGMIRDGIYKVYGSDGNLKVWETQEGLRRNGTAVEFFDNGEVKRLVSYKNDELNGAVAVYDSDGRVAYRRYFRDGQLHGSTVRYYENGRPRLELTYRNGELEGPVSHYTSDGVLEQVVVYHNGRVVSVKSFQEKGSDGKEKAAK